MTSPRRDSGEDDGEPPRVSVLAIPLFLGALLVCAVASYLLGPLALIVVALVVVGALTLAIREPAHREASVAAVAGALIGFVGVMLIALLHYMGHR